MFLTKRDPAHDEFWGPPESSQSILETATRHGEAFRASEREMRERKRREKRNEQLARLGGLGAGLAAMVGGNMYANRKWLTRAVQNNDLKTVKRLLKEGADVNAKEMGPMGLTVTQRAAVEGYEKVFDELMKHKPDLKVKDSQGNDIFQMMKNNLDFLEKEQPKLIPGMRKTYNAMKRIQTKLNRRKKSSFGKKRKVVKRRKTVKKRKVVKRPSKRVRDQAKRCKLKLTVKRGNRRVYKSEKVLLAQIKRKMK